jgi:hypothetical protein
MALNQIHIKRLSPLLVIFLVMGILFGCAQRNTLSQKDEFVTSTTPTKEMEKSVTPEFTDDVSESYPCLWPAEIISKIPTAEFAWVDDSKLLYQEATTQYFIYDTYTGEREPSTTPIEGGEVYDDIIAKNFGIGEYLHIYLSPKGNFIVFTKRNEEGYTLYQKELGTSSQLEIGNIQGVIDKHYWINDGEDLILTMNWQSPLGIKEAYVYKIDIKHNLIDIIIPNTPEYRELTVFEITPDQESLLYVLYSGDDRFIRIYNFVTKTTTQTDIWNPWSIQWVPNSNELIVVGRLGSGEPYSIYKYNISTHKLMMTDITFDFVHSMLVEISMNAKYIAYIDEKTQDLLVIDCSDFSE